MARLENCTDPQDGMCTKLKYLYKMACIEIDIDPTEQKIEKEMNFSIKRQKREETRGETDKGFCQDFPLPFLTHCLVSENVLTNLSFEFI